MMRPRAWTVLVAVTLGVGCVGGVVPPRATDADDVREMKSRILELQRKAAVTEVELQRLQREVATLRQQLDRAAGGAAPKAATALPSTPRSAEEPVVEEKVPPPPPRPVVEEADLAPPPPARVPPGRAEAPPAAAAAGSAAVGFTPLDPEAQALYDRGYTQFHQGRHVDAESSFQQFLQRYRDTALADNAQYWIGECRYARGDLAGALAAFEEAVRRYPDGNKVPDALVKQGTCLEGLGDAAAAAERYDEVIRRFPGSAAAAIAEERRAGSR